MGWLWMLPHAYAQLSSDVFASAAFAANIALMLQSGYFDIELAKKPLLHLWSLGIEEQFYLAWPLILMLAARWRIGLLAVAGVIAVASFIFNVVLIGHDPVATFYLPFTRAWELLAGAVLALPGARVDQSEAASNRRAGIGVVLDRDGGRRAQRASRLSRLVGAVADRRQRPVVVGACIMDQPDAARLAADGVDRLDQLSALSLALAAAGDVRDHQIRAADPGRYRVGPAFERGARLGHLLVRRKAAALRRSACVQGRCAGRCNGRGRVRRRGHHRRPRFRFPSARRNPRDGRRAGAERAVARGQVSDRPRPARPILPRNASNAIAGRCCCSGATPPRAR